MTGIATRLGTLLEITSVEQLRELPRNTVYSILDPEHWPGRRIWRLDYEGLETRVEEPWVEVGMYDGDSSSHENLPLPGIAWMPPKEK